MAKNEKLGRHLVEFLEDSQYEKDDKFFQKLITNIKALWMIYRNAELDSTNALLVATKFGRTAIVKAMIKKGADLNRKIFDKETALDIAIEKHYDEIALCLIEAKADLKEALHTAAYFANHTIAEKLLEIGVDINETNEYGDTALHYATCMRNYKMAKFLIDSGANINVKNHYGMTPLINVIYNDDYNMCQILINSGADVNLGRGKINNNSALHIAVDNGNLDIVKLLIKSGANLNFKNIYGITPIQYALYRADVLSEKFDDDSKRFLPSFLLESETKKYNDIKEIIFELLKSGADVSTVTDDGRQTEDFTRNPDYKKLIQERKEKAKETSNIKKTKHKKTNKQQNMEM